MFPSEPLGKEMDEKHVELVAKFISDVRNGKIEGSKNVALATVTLLEQIINDSEDDSVVSLILRVRSAGVVLARALPRWGCAGNMARRLLRALRDESRAEPGGEDSARSAGDRDSLARLVLAAPRGRRRTLPAAAALREPIREHLTELRTELEGAEAAISAQAEQHVHAHETLLAFGHGRLLERFLRAGRHYRLLLAEGTEPRESQLMAARLSAAGVPVTLLSSAAVCAVMSRVNKVVISVSALLAGGAALGAAGLQAVAAAAKHYSVPVLALCPLWALSPLHARDPAQLAALAQPANSLPYQGAGGAGGARVVAPVNDLIPADHVTLYITNLGGSSPSYIYRLLSELYDPSDYVL